MEAAAVEVVGGALFEEAAALGVSDLVGAAGVEAAGAATEAVGSSLASESAIGADAALGVNQAANLSGETFGTITNQATEIGANAAADTVGTGPAVEGTPTAQSQTQKLAQQILEGPTPDAGDVTRDATDVARGANGANPTPPKTGIIDKAMDWVSKNPTAATIAGTQIAGALGGAGKAALEKEIARRNIQARKDLLTQQTDEQMRLSQTGTYKGAPGVNPSGQKILYRPDGTPVFANGGIIGSQLN